MLIALKQNGVAEIVAPSRLFRGSEAEEYIVLSPYPNTVPLQIAFISPLGENSGYLPMTSVELPEQYQNLGLSAKSYVDTLAIGTNEVGDAYICICAILPGGENGSVGIKKTSYMCQYTVEETALPTLPEEEPTVSQYDDILRYMANYETKINNAAKQSLNAEEAAESATEIAEEAKEQANAALINSARALLEANRKRLLDFTVNSNTGIGTKYFSDGTTATVQFPIGGGSAEEVAGTPLTSITFLASQFVDGELAISPMATGYTDNNFIVSVEEKALTNGYIQTANNVFKGTDGSILLSYNEPFDGRILLFGGGRLANSGGTYNYEDLENLPSINSTELLGNKTSAELGIYDMGVYPSTATLNKTEPSVSNTIAFGSIGFLGKPLTALKHGDFIVDKYGTVAIIDTVDLENFTATYFTWTYHEVPQDVWEAIDLARTIAEGRSRAVVVNLLKNMVQILNSFPLDGFRLGDNIYIRQLDVPDYWISFANGAEQVEYTYVDDATTIEYINNNGQIGWFFVSALETNKVEIPRDYNDLENKPTINGVEIVGNMTSADLKLGMQTSQGGYQGGIGAAAEYGGAIGENSVVNDGGAIGSRAYTIDGGAVGQYANSTYGGAVGTETKTSTGGSVGNGAKSKNGFAGGEGANARYAPDGITQVEGAVAIGKQAKARANNAIQLGTGINDEENTMKVGDYKLLNANGKIPTERLPEGDDSAFTSLARGQSIEKIVFNPNVSVEKMTNYLASLTYDREISGIPSICNLFDLMGWDGEANASNGATFLHVYAIDFSKLNAIVPNTSGYGIAVCETLNENLVLKQAVFASEYNEANVTLVNAIKDPNYVLNYTKAGWSDTNDYNVSTYIGTTNGDYTIQSITVFNVHDNKVSAFVGRDSRFFEVVEMLDNGTVLNEYYVELKTDTKENIDRISNIVKNAKSIGEVAINNNKLYHVNGGSNNSNTVEFVSVRTASTSSLEIKTYTCFATPNVNNRQLEVTIQASGNTVTNYSNPFTVKITYYNDVEITE